MTQVSIQNLNFLLCVKYQSWRTIRELNHQQKKNIRLMPMHVYGEKRKELGIKNNK